MKYYVLAIVGIRNIEADNKDDASKQALSTIQASMINKGLDIVNYDFRAICCEESKGVNDERD